MLRRLRRIDLTLAALIVAESAPEHQVRDMNDEINKLMREKGHWERRIVELSGPDYSVIGFSPRHFTTLTRLLDGQKSAKITDDDGMQVPGGRGAYRYYGAAKKLPGVAELFRQERKLPKCCVRTLT